ncbi:hypothetical protein BDR05DRAFT_731161 [Suillus weaverae]|nr:hypothetical protein BDR05DRAFT_731161 [Suillus weaverae]
MIVPTGEVHDKRRIALYLCAYRLCMVSICAHDMISIAVKHTCCVVYSSQRRLSTRLNNNHFHLPSYTASRYLPGRREGVLPERCSEQITIPTVSTSSQF